MPTVRAEAERLPADPAFSQLCNSTGCTEVASV